MNKKLVQILLNCFELPKPPLEYFDVLLVYVLWCKFIQEISTYFVYMGKY